MQAMLRFLCPSSVLHLEVTLGSSTCVHDVCCHTDGQGSGSVCSGQSTFAGRGNNPKHLETSSSWKK